MIGETMRNELPPAIDTGFHSAVMARIHHQPGHESGRGAGAQSGRSTAPQRISSEASDPLSWHDVEAFGRFGGSRECGYGYGRLVATT